MNCLGRQQYLWDLRSSGILRSVSGNSLPTFPDNLPVPFSRVRNFVALQDGALDCPETSVGHYHLRCVISQKNAYLIYFAAEARNHAQSVCYLLVLIELWLHFLHSWYVVLIVVRVPHGAVIWFSVGIKWDAACGLGPPECPLTVAAWNDTLHSIIWPAYPFTDEAQTALFKDPVRTAL